MNTAVFYPRFFDAGPEPMHLREEVVDGLARRPKRLSPKLLYDARGSALFDTICELPEYYPTRTETAILQDNAADIAGLIGEECVLIEPGAGSCHKAELLLCHLPAAAYVPTDICGDHVREAASRLATRFPRLEVASACADFSQFEVLSSFVPSGRRVVFFPGSTIGNFEPHEAKRFLVDAASFVGADGGLLIGVDLKKEPERLRAAYNDARGITAEFNLNLLTRLNRELQGDFDVNRFRHQAFYEMGKGRVEMHLISEAAQEVSIAGLRFRFVPGETIHTENSYKYTIQEFHRLAGSAGFVPGGVWTDRQRLFSVHYLTPRIAGAGPSG
ncbi:L-histidine N(alpha)-methyltransferase [Thiohalomonas denitrificans]|uniref:L-histidine N(alpha)-methyltransferase n=1 Tax=Thiohalomonas denitrificans TaxID=415747 RepID=UPI0026F2845C|nr:L-histidine N(alpha)-methyltransferase [Thiohalomonas denitrificans]